MGIIRILLIIIEVVVCLLLIGVILLQKSRDSGLGMAFGAGMGESLFGAQAGNVLTRITIALASVFLVNTTLLAVIQPVRDGSLIDRARPRESARPFTPSAADSAREQQPQVMPYTFPDDTAGIAVDAPPGDETTATVPALGFPASGFEDDYFDGEQIDVPDADEDF